MGHRGEVWHLDVGTIGQWMDILYRGGRAHAIVDEQGAVLAAVMIFRPIQGRPSEVYALMGWRSRPRMLTITRHLRKILDATQGCGDPLMQARLLLPVIPSTHRWIRLLGFRLAAMPYENSSSRVWMRFIRGAVEPALAHQGE